VDSKRASVFAVQPAAGKKQEEGPADLLSARRESTLFHHEKPLEIAVFLFFMDIKEPPNYCSQSCKLLIRVQK
jgi:hypothetical protein